MKPNIVSVAYVGMMLLCAYLTLSSGFIIYAHLIGMKIIIFHPLLPFTDEYIGEFTIMPQIIQFAYLVATWIFFAVIGWGRRKEK